MKTIILIASILLMGCDQNGNTWEPRDYKCSNEQMKIVESDTLFCSKHTTYKSSYCYAIAMERHCPKIDQSKGE